MAGMAGAVRLLFAIPQAVLVTVLLILLMISLIEFGDRPLEQQKRIRLPDIHMPEVDVAIPRLIEKPDRPEQDETPPPEIPEQDFDRIDGNAAVGEIRAVGRMETRLDLNIGAGLRAADGEYLPIVKVAPQYPRRALRRGVEGHVVLQYTVTPLGAVQDPVVVESEPEGVFDKVAIESALRYKYKPRVIDGQPREVRNVRTRIVFRLSDAPSP